MYNIEKDRLFQGLFSTAGIVSAEKYNILEEFQKAKNKNRNNVYHDSFLPDKEWKQNLKKKEIINSNDIIKGCRFNINELKSEIDKKNLYFKDESPKNSKSNRKKANKSTSNKNIFLRKKNKNPIINRKYKYHDLHMKKIARYKKEGIYEKILRQQESTYYPKMDFVYKKIESGPKWEKLAGRGNLFEQNIKQYNSIDANSNLSEIRVRKLKLRNRNQNLNYSNISSTIIPELSRNNNKNITRNKLDSAKSNVNTKSTSTHSKIHFLNKNNNNNNNYITSNSENFNIINNTIFNYNSRNKDRSESEKKLILKNPNRTSYPINKCKSVLEFSKYMDYAKLEKKIQKKQQIFRIKDIINPNYSYIEGEIKMFVKYGSPKHSKKVKNKKIEFEGINTNELLYDASQTFDRIYGNKMKAVPLFHKMIARPNDINLPSYMKGLYSRMGLFLTSEKTLQMNNYENSKMYKFEGDFTPKKRNTLLRKVVYEDEINDDINKIHKDLENMKKKFRNIQFQIYE